MRTFIDPHVYSYDRAEWEEFRFTDRLEKLLDTIIAIDNFEKSRELPAGSVRFRVSPEDLQSVFESNPFLNAPVITGPYGSNYMTRIFPELTRRFDVCPCGVPKRELRKPLESAVVLDDDDHIARRFVNGIERCRTCGIDGETCLLYHRDKVSVVLPSAFFDFHVEVGQHLEPAILEPLSFFPEAGTSTQRLKDLRIALEIERYRLALQDREWLDFDIRDITALESFWTELDHADFRGLEKRYKRRILNSILQIATGRSSTAYLHRMTGQTFVYKKLTYLRSNAYVFQSGASDQDRRCSRIYYGTGEAGVVLQAYDADAH